jgi:UrcA family protein
MTASIRTLPSKFTTRVVAAAAALGLTIAFMPVARADAASDAPKIEVSYADLDISTEQGAHALYRRIAHAARQVCPGPSSGSVIPKLEEISRKCVAEAISRAVREVNSPRLAELEAAFHTKTG